MTKVQFSIPDDLFVAFNTKYPEASREAVFTELMRQLVEPSPYSEEAFAEDERRYQNYLDTGEALSTEQVLAQLRTQLHHAGLLACGG